MNISNFHTFWYKLLYSIQIYIMSWASESCPVENNLEVRVFVRSEWVIGNQSRDISDRCVCSYLYVCDELSSPQLKHEHHCVLNMPIQDSKSVHCKVPTPGREPVTTWRSRKVSASQITFGTDPYFQNVRTCQFRARGSLWFRNM